MFLMLGVVGVRSRCTLPRSSETARSLGFAILPHRKLILTSDAGPLFLRFNLSLSSSQTELERTSLRCFSRDLQLENVEIIVADITTFEMEGSYDRILSIEMFEVTIALCFVVVDVKQIVFTVCSES